MSGPLVVRLHDDVVVGPLVVRGARVLRLGAAARELLSDRDVAATDAVRRMLVDRLLDLDLARVVGGEVPPLSDVTAVVPVRDDADGVEALLTTLRGQVSCVVVDDASSDPAALRAVVERHGARLVRLEANAGPAAARDVGLAEVVTPLVVFVDADVVVEPEDLAALLVDLADPRLALVAPRVRTRGGRRWFERYEDACGALDLGPETASVRPMSAVSYVPSACLMGRVDLIGRGFDASMRSGEDVDLVWRLLAAGHRVRYRADVHAWHRHRGTVPSWLSRRTTYGRSAAPLAARHGSRTAPAALWDTAVVAVGAAVAQRPWSLPACAAIGLRVWRRVGVAHPQATARQRAGLVGFEARATVHQTSGLALRHWWPLTLLLAHGSHRARRAVLVLAIADTVSAHRRTQPDLDLVRFGVARRLDDLAYGAGVWAGAIRARSVRCLLPTWISRRSG